MAATQQMTWTIHRYIAAPNEPSPVLDWLRAASGQAEEIPLPRGVAFHFRQLGELLVRGGLQHLMCIARRLGRCSFPTSAEASCGRLVRCTSGDTASSIVPTL